MSAANPTTATLDPVVPRAAAPARTDSTKRRRGPTPARIAAFVILAVLALAWLVPVLWAVLTSFKTEAEAAAMPVPIVPEG
ncbi:MAG: carbohydrate ABC transporter permease, partial [Brachybacterium sp.]